MTHAPASGYRGNGSGSLYIVGAGGYAWSSAPNSATSVYGSSLYFTSSYVYPEFNGNGGRAHGIPVRCVQE